MVPCPQPGRPYREEEEGRKRRGGGEGRWEEKEKGEGRRRREEEEGEGRRRRKKKKEKGGRRKKKKEEEEGEGGRRRRTSVRRPFTPFIDDVRPLRRPRTSPFVHVVVPVPHRRKGKGSRGVGLGAIYVLTAFVPGLCMCGPSCPKCGRRPSCWLFLAGFWKPPHTGEVLPNFSSNSDVFLLLQSRSCRRGPRAPRRSRSSSSALRSRLHCFVSPLHRIATAPLAFLHRHPRYN